MSTGEQSYYTINQMHTPIYRTHKHTHKQMSETQSPEVVFVSGGTDSISAVLDTGNDFCQSHLYCNYDMIIMCFIIYTWGRYKAGGFWLTTPPYSRKGREKAQCWANGHYNDYKMIEDMNNLKMLQSNCTN